MDSREIGKKIVVLGKRIKKEDAEASEKTYLELNDLASELVECAVAGDKFAKDCVTEFLTTLDRESGFKSFKNEDGEVRYYIPSSLEWLRGYVDSDGRRHQARGWKSLLSASIDAILGDEIASLFVGTF